MEAARSAETLVLTFSSLESEILGNILRTVVNNYQTKPQDLDPKVAGAWYSTRGCQSAKMSAEDTREWIEHLHQYKSATLQHLLKWLRRLSACKAGQCRLKLKLTDAPMLLTAMNDHRLLMAATHDIGQKEMDMKIQSAQKLFPPARRVALSEIHFLGCLIEEILRCVPGNPAGWMEEL